MVEWFENLYNWFILHKDDIVLFFTSTNFLAFLSTVVLLVKQIRTTCKNNQKVDALSNDLTSATTVEKSVDNIQQVVQNVEEVQTSMIASQKETDDKLNILLQKLQACLDVQAIVYSNFTDDTARKNINNILTTAKLLETSTVADLKAQLEELQLSIAEKVNDVKETVAVATSKVQNVVDTTTSKISRY